MASSSDLTRLCRRHSLTVAGSEGYGRDVSGAVLAGAGGAAQLVSAKTTDYSQSFGRAETGGVCTVRRNGSQRVIHFSTQDWFRGKLLDLQATATVLAVPSPARRLRQIRTTLTTVTHSLVTLYFGSPTSII